MTPCCSIGGAGFIGQHLAQTLIASGRQVRVVDLHIPESTLSPKIKYLQGDIRDARFLAESVKGVDELVDLAYLSVPKTSFEDPIADITENLPSSVALFEMAGKLPLKKMIFVSSGGTVYGEPVSLPISETHPTSPISPYGITKLALEKYAFMFHKLKGLPIVCVRPSNPFGEGQRPFIGQGFIATAIASILSGLEISIFGASGTIRDYIYVGDAVKGIVSALDRGVAGECYNIGSGVGRSNLDVIKAISRIAKEYGHEVKVRHAPERSFDVTANILDCKKLNNISGWVPEIDFESALRQTYDWQLKQTHRDNQ